MSPEFEILNARVENLAEQLKATTKASIILDLSIISLLVDSGLEPDAVIKRIEALYNSLDAAQSPAVLERLELILLELRNQPGATA